jgi:uncharacterized damage-inducible protein DinB
MNINRTFLEESIKSFRGLKSNAEKAIEQISDAEMHWSYNEESNSVVIIVKHMAGNMISRWTDFLTTDGEKPDRNRDGEFEDDFKSRELVMNYWNRGWKIFLDTLNSLGDDDLEKTVYIRKEPHTVIRAIQRQLAHYAYHTGQIVYLAKQIKGKDFKTLSIARGESLKYVAVAPKSGA